jgi:L-2-hydroxyglutarate oxidase LhgO
MDHFDITIIGAGVVGLAVAEEVSGRGRRVLVVERNTTFGQETSSRNSEVIHAGIYYTNGFLKAQLCVEGNRLLYGLCRERNISHRAVGKLIVATEEKEIPELYTIKERAERNGVADLAFLSRKEIAEREPTVKAVEALFSPSTGIVDSHSLMRSFCHNAEAAGATVAFRSEVTDVRFDGNDYEMEINRGEYRFRTAVVINSAGLHSDRVAELAGIDIDAKDYRLKYCKGDYFSISPSPGFRHLVYPVPVKHHAGLGVHATIDLQGRVRFGPDVEYVSELNYVVKEEKRESFYGAIKTYLPSLRLETLSPDMSGIRPKLQAPGEPERDFVISDEREAGLPGLINLIGIESPGLTSCVAIARRVHSLIQPYL